MINFIFSFDLQYGIKCLKMLNYDRDALADRRRAVEEENRDVIIWGNDRVIRWAISIGLKVCKMFMIFFYFLGIMVSLLDVRILITLFLVQDYANNLIESGVHGALIALDEGFDANAFALALKIPTPNQQVTC